MNNLQPVTVADGGLIDYSARFKVNSGDVAMSMDKSLKISGGLQRARSVLKRAERIEKLMKDDRWEEGMSPLGLPKIKVVRAVIKKAKKKEKKEDEEGGEEATPTS